MSMATDHLRPPAIPADMLAHYEAFAAYARSFYTGGADHDFHLDLKVEHTLNVFGHARDLARHEQVFSGNPPIGRALLLAALYHDFGRFPQYARYGTFSDAASVNHARLAVTEVRRLGLLAGEEPSIRSLVLAGIAAHNRFRLPEGFSPLALAVARAVRDADKLDIMRIMARHLTGVEPGDPVVLLGVTASPKVSPAILRAAMGRTLAAYGDMATTTDFTLLVCGWLYDLNFRWSRRAAARSAHLADLAASLPRSQELAAFLTQYTADLAAYAA